MKVLVRLLIIRKTIGNQLPKNTGVKCEASLFRVFLFIFRSFWWTG